jgi:hypothetical protein
MRRMPRMNSHFLVNSLHGGGPRTGIDQSVVGLKIVPRQQQRGREQGVPMQRSPKDLSPNPGDRQLFSAPQSPAKARTDVGSGPAVTYCRRGDQP